jgi:hypothetical protein
MHRKAAFLFVFLVPATALAQQLVTFDQVVTITQQGNGSGAFHYTIKPAATEPGSWTTPVDYSKGTAHLHLDVTAKPSKRNTAITICFDGNLAGYGCIATGSYTDVGKYDTARVLPTATWQYDKIAWNRRRQEYHLVVKDPALGGTPGGRPASDYVPTTMRIVMTIVPPGGTYAPPPGAAAPAADAGAADAVPPTADASPAPAPVDAAAPAPVDAAAPAVPADAAVATDTASAPSPAGPSPPGNVPPATGNPPPAAAGGGATGGCSLGGAGGSAGGLVMVMAMAAALLPALARRRVRRRRFSP